MSAFLLLLPTLPPLLLLLLLLPPPPPLPLCLSQHSTSSLTHPFRLHRLLHCSRLFLLFVRAGLHISIRSNLRITTVNLVMISTIALAVALRPLLFLTTSLLPLPAVKWCDPAMASHLFLAAPYRSCRCGQGLLHALRHVMDKYAGYTRTARAADRMA